MSCGINYRAVTNVKDCDAILVKSVEFLFESFPVEEYDIYEDSITLRIRYPEDENSIKKQFRMILTDGSKSGLTQIDREPKWLDRGLLEIHTTYKPWKRFSFEGFEKY